MVWSWLLYYHLTSIMIWNIVLITLHFAKHRKVCHEGVQDAFGLLFYTNFFLFDLSLVSWKGSGRRKCLDKKKQWCFRNRNNSAHVLLAGVMIVWWTQKFVLAENSSMPLYITSVLPVPLHGVTINCDVFQTMTNQY